MKYRQLNTVDKSFVDDGSEVGNEGRKALHMEKLKVFAKMPIEKGRFTRRRPFHAGGSVPLCRDSRGGLQENKSGIGAAFNQ